MFARVAMFEGIDLDNAAGTGEEAQRRLGEVFRQMPGWQRTIDLATDEGKILAISLFDSEESMRDAESTFDEDMPVALGDLMRDWAGRRTGVEYYRVIFDTSA
jgi:hypothetical protein